MSYELKYIKIYRNIKYLNDDYDMTKYTNTTWVYKLSGIFRIHMAEKFAASVVPPLICNRMQYFDNESFT